MRKGQLHGTLFRPPGSTSQQEFHEQGVAAAQAHRKVGTLKETTQRSAKAAAGKCKTKPKPQYGALPLHQARVLNQLQALTLKPPAAKQFKGTENVDTATTAVPTRHQVSAARQPNKPVHQRLQKLRRAVLASSGDTDSEVESPLSQPPHARQQISASPAAELTDAHQASTPSRLQPASVCEAPAANSPDSMALSTPVCGQAPLSCSSQAVAPMSCTSVQLSNNKPGLPYSTLNKASNQGSPMCISPDLWATPQQLQWELSEEHDQPQSPAEQTDTIQAKRWPAASHSQLQAAVLEFGLDAVQTASKAPKSRLANLSQADGASGQSLAPDCCIGLACGRGFNADSEYLDDFELSQSQTQPTSELQDVQQPHALRQSLPQPSGAEECLGQSKVSQHYNRSLNSPLVVAACFVCWQFLRPGIDFMTESAALWQNIFYCCICQRLCCTQCTNDWHIHMAGCFFQVHLTPLLLLLSRSRS